MVHLMLHLDVSIMPCQDADLSITGLRRAPCSTTLQKAPDARAPSAVRLCVPPFTGPKVSTLGKGAPHCSSGRMRHSSHPRTSLGPEAMKYQVSSFEACKDIVVGNDDVTWAKRMRKSWVLEPPHHRPEIVAAVSNVKSPDQNEDTSPWGPKALATQRGAAARGLASIPIQASEQVYLSIASCQASAAV